MKPCANKCERKPLVLVLMAVFQFPFAEFRIARQEDAFRQLNLRSSNLKKILSRIPDEIDNRRKFLDTIK